MSKELTIKYKVIEEDEVQVDIVSNTAPTFNWAKVVDRSHVGIIESLKKSQNREDHYKDQFIKETAEFLGKSEKEIREKLDCEDEKGAAIALLLESVVKKLEENKTKRKKDE